MALEAELKTFQERLPDLLRHNSGQYAVIKRNVLLGTFTTFNEAFAAGVAEWGNQEFLIHMVTDEPVTVQFPALQVGLLNARP